MKCQYCGNNLDIESEVCPYCGKVNKQAAKYVAEIKNYKEDYDKTKDDAGKKAKTAGRIARLAIIAVLVLVVLVMQVSIKRNSDFKTREKDNAEKIAKNIEKNRDKVSATLKDLEKNREYLEMSYYILELKIRGDETYSEYSRVFNAAIEYEAIYEDVLSIVSGFTRYDSMTKQDWCNDIAVYVSGWSKYVDGMLWHDSPDSVMHSGEHGAFIADCKSEIQDMLQVYFELSDSQASALWNMEEEEIGELLYSKCQGKELQNE